MLGFVKLVHGAGDSLFFPSGHGGHPRELPGRPQLWEATAVDATATTGFAASVRAFYDGFKVYRLGGGAQFRRRRTQQPVQTTRWCFRPFRSATPRASSTRSETGCQNYPVDFSPPGWFKSRSVCVCFCVCLSVSLYLYVGVSVHLCISVSICVCVCVFLFLYLSLTLSLCCLSVSVAGSEFISVSVSVFVFTRGL